MTKTKDELEDAVNRLECAERRLHSARIDRDAARQAVNRAKENLKLARLAMRDAQRK